MELQGLTTQERRIFNCLVRHLKKMGTPPSMRDIRDVLGRTSVGGTHKLVWSLARKGWITVNKYQARSMMPTEAALQFCERIARVSPPFVPGTKTSVRRAGQGGSSPGTP